VNVVASCDVDDSQSAKPREDYPKANH